MAEQKAAKANINRIFPFITDYPSLDEVAFPLPKSGFYVRTLIIED